MSNASRVPTSSEKRFNLPTTLATLISVGLHALIWVIQPVLSSSSKSAESDPRRIVGFVQLTPDELSRLPEYSLAKPTLPSLAPPPPKNLLPPLPPVQSYTPLPPIPSVPLDNTPTIPLSPPSVTSSEPSSQRRSASRRQEITPKEREAISQPEIKIESRQSPQTAIVRERPTTAERTPTPERAITAKRTATPEAAPTPKAAPTPEAATTPEATITPEATTTPEGQNIAKGTQSGVRPNDTLPELPPGTVSPSLSPSPSAIQTLPKIAEPVNPSNLQTRLPNFYPKASPTPQQSQEFADSLIKYRYGYDSNVTSPQYAAGKLRTWLDEKNKQFSANLKITTMADIIFVKSPIEEKLPDVTQANVAVLVNPNGKKEGTPEVIRSTGYPRLDRAAIENIQKLGSFPSTRKYEVYLYRIEIEQNDSPSTPGASSNS